MKHLRLFVSVTLLLMTLIIGVISTTRRVTANKPLCTCTEPRGDGVIISGQCYAWSCEWITAPPP